MSSPAAWSDAAMRDGWIPPIAPRPRGGPAYAVTAGVASPSHLTDFVGAAARSDRTSSGSAQPLDNKRHTKNERKRSTKNEKPKGPARRAPISR
jgi:hypothetical protein